VKIGINSSKHFNDYAVFQRAMGVALSPLRDNPEELVVYCAGPLKLNGMVSGFVNLTEDGMKNRGMSIKYKLVPMTVLKKTLGDLDAFFYLQRPNDTKSDVTVMAELLCPEVNIFRY